MIGIPWERLKLWAEATKSDTRIVMACWELYLYSLMVAGLMTALSEG
jgi:hypothetical protein